MQLVQPSKFFSVRTCSHVRAGAMLLFLVTLKNFDVCVQLLWELHALFSEGVYKPLMFVYCDSGPSPLVRFRRNRFIEA